MDTALQTSREGLRALKISLAILALTASVQVVIVAISGSVALLADSIHNFADALTAVPLGVAFWLGRRPPSRRYTYGFGRAEDLAGVCIVLMVAASAGVVGWQSIDRLRHPQMVSHIGWVMAAGLVGFVGNELVARYRIRVGRTIGSAALEADGYHARTDGVTSLGVVAGAIGVALGWRAADPVVGLFITVAILLVVKNAARDIYRRLMDAVDPALVDQIGSVLASTPGIVAVDGVRVRWVGHELHAEVDVTSDADVSLATAHAIAEEARHHLLHQVRRLSSITIHSSPTAVPGHDPHALTSHHFNR
jgi:cation diffusion facilitator family transporter